MSLVESKVASYHAWLSWPERSGGCRARPEGQNSVPQASYITGAIMRVDGGLIPSI